MPLPRDTLTLFSMSEIFNIVIGTAGHIDHGKSTLVRKLTGIDPDRLPEEKERGLTIDLGFAPFILKDGRRIGIIDVPGHEKFVKNMVAGATSLDGVILVIAADDGIMPQTREHLNILRILDVKRGMIALTKVDMAEPDMVELVEDEIRGMVAGTFLENAPIFRVSSLTGAGYEALIDGINKLAVATPPRPTDGIFRMPIQRVFSAKGFGTIATGVPITGKAKLGDTLEILPLGKTSRVRGLQAYKGDVAEIRAGHSSAVNLSDIDHAEVVRGMVMATPGYLHAADHVNARFRFLNEDVLKLKNLSAVRLHTGTVEGLGTLNLIEGQDLLPGTDALVQIRLAEPVVVAANDLFVLRLQSPTVVLGGGRILSSTLGRPKLNRAKLVEDLKGAEAALGDVRKTVEHLLRRAGSDPVSMDSVSKQALLPLAQTYDLVGGLKQKGVAVDLSDSKRLMHRDGLAEAADEIGRALEEFHKANPVSVGMDKIALRTATGLDPEAFEAALALARNSGRATDERGYWRKAAHAVALTAEQEKLIEAARKLLLADKFATPRVDEMAPKLGKTPQAVDKLLKLMMQTGEIVRLKDDILLHRDAIAEAADVARRLCKELGEVGPAEFRDAMKTSRKYVIPLLEHLDAIGVTVRHGDKRVLKA
ncbi:MAG: selenocysteine-specific translation elongation factor [Planctomycetes bacterium]|nr:selenocysteine-specific translation elongation factor [Planctomycetota bacterium]